MSSRELPLPTFLIIGAQKCATRWLRFNLGLHPDVYAAAAELSFFNNGPRFEDLGVTWYRDQFEGWNGEPVVGEATPGYMFWRHRPYICRDRIREVVPEVRLIAILRNPIDRAQSAMIHHVASSGLPPDSDLLDLVERTPPERDKLGLVSGGWYAESLEPYRDTFGDKLLVLLHDDIAADARAFYRRAADHVGATRDFVPPDLEEVRFSYRQRPGAGHKGIPPLTTEKRRALYEYFADDLAKLENMIGRDLSMWDPTARS
ncbi:MAG TPA: hypothetical protein VL856_14165 [Acidimicrobiia bacterium]|jgi:hypothetical protein|nr:hypothetical protein [Acidimicrobiia bacterium]